MTDRRIELLQLSLCNAYLDKDINHQLFCIMSAIKEASGALVASIWSIDEKDCLTSLLKRYVPEEYAHLFVSDSDYVHESPLSFVEVVQSYTKSNKCHFYGCELATCRQHRSYDALVSIGIRSCVGIPIHDRVNNSIIAIICLYYRSPYDDAYISILAEALNDNISALLERNLTMKKQFLSEKVFQIKKELKDLTSPRLFFDRVLKVIKNYQCEFEGGSVFIWDAYDKRFNLSATTGLVDAEGKEVFYYAGEGLTGSVAVTKQITIYKSLEKEISNNDHKEKWKEKTANLGKTMMVIPIVRVSTNNDVVGIIRLINKRNRENHKTLDYFNPFDVKVIWFLAGQISLILESYLSEEMKSDFITQLSHEMKTPTQAILKSASALLDHLEVDDQFFLERNLKKYLEDIAYFSEFQKWQIRTNLYLSKTDTNKKLSEVYSVSDVALSDILSRSKSLINPIARLNNIKIDSIILDHNIPRVTIYVDFTAFVTVFYNLLANAIKYRNPATQFYINVSAFRIKRGTAVEIEDYGIGIQPEDADKIFQLGYRGDNVIRKKMGGFGVGLAVAKKLLSDFGCSISVTNFHNPTRFRIEIPYQLESDKYTRSELWKL